MFKYRKTNNVVVYNGNRKIFDYHDFKESGPEMIAATTDNRK